MRARAEFPGSGETAMEEAVLLAAVFNAPSYGGGLRVAPDALLDDRQLDVAFVQDLSASQMLRALVKLLRNGTLPEAYVKRGRGRSVVLSADRPCMFHGDGEIVGSTPVQIEVIPRGIRVLAPQVLATSK